MADFDYYAPGRHLNAINQMQALDYNASDLAITFSNTLASEIPGTLDLAALNLGKTYQLQRAIERNEMSEGFAADSEAYQIQALKQQQLSADFSERLGQMNDRLSVIKGQANQAASKASSQREYSMLAKKAMEGSRRYLQELEAFSAPEAPNIDFTFADPITGERLDVNTEFEDIYTDDFNVADKAREKVMKDFTTLRDRYYDESLAAMYDEYGRPEDYAAGGSMEFGGDFATGSAQVEAAKAYRIQREKSFGAAEMATNYAEAAALAEMGGFTDYTVNPRSMHARDATTFDAATMFYKQDINKVLDNMVGVATERLEIDRITDRETTEAEFKRRKQLAQSQFGLYEGQKRRNAAEAERIEAERQRMRQSVAQQEADYQQTMSSFGGSPDSKGQGIQFTDTRPQ